MKPNTREAVESPLYQGEDEAIAYVLDTSNWGGSPTSPVCTIIETKTQEDVSSTYLESGSPSVSGDNITSPKVSGIVAGTQYRLQFQWVSSGNTFEAFVTINGQQ